MWFVTLRHKAQPEEVTIIATHADIIDRILAAFPHRTPWQIVAAGRAEENDNEMVLHRQTKPQNPN